MHRNLTLLIVGPPLGAREATLVELDLRRLDGVYQVHVDVETQTTHLHHNPAAVSAETIAAKIRDLGYETHAAEDVVVGALVTDGEESQLLDVVCGAVVFLHETAKLHRTVSSGSAYFFCSSECHDAFRAAPERYLKDFEDKAS